jgi:hypothetical protein
VDVGTQTAAIIAGGVYILHPQFIIIAESWDGTAWSEVSELIQHGRY